MTDAELAALVSSAPLPTIPPAPDVPRGHRTAPTGDPYVVCANKRTYYVRNLTGWSPPLAAENVALELRRAWPAAEGRPALRLTVPSPKGDRPAKPAEILEKYGRHCEEVVYTYLGPRYDYATETIYIPVARRVDVTPAESATAAEYLSTAAGENLERLLDWLATYGNVAHPTAALVLTGPKFAGKSTLLHAIAAPWGGWADLGLVLGDFQDSARRSPIWAADEGLALPSKRGTVRLREAITARNITINPKGQPAGRLEGSPRIITASNDADPLKFGAELFNDDSAAAIASRIIHIELTALAAEFLNKHRELTAEVLAAHFAWLANTRHPAPYGRLLVEGNGAEFVKRAAGDTPQAGQVYARILVLADSAPTEGGLFGAGSAVVYRDADNHPGMLLVRSGELSPGGHWPHARTVAAALRAAGGAVLAGGRSRVWAVPETALREKCDY